MSISLSDYVSQVINDPKYGSDIEWVKLNLQRAHLESIESTYLAERLSEGLYDSLAYLEKEARDAHGDL